MGILTNATTLYEPWGHYALWSKPMTKRHILCDSINIRNLDIPHGWWLPWKATSGSGELFKMYRALILPNDKILAQQYEYTCCC